MTIMDSTPLDEKFHAVLFDLDGVLTPTALIHMRAWQEMFNEELSRHQGQNPYTGEDYFATSMANPDMMGYAIFLPAAASLFLRVTRLTAPLPRRFVG
ncbi:haloacid dehalogenase-like hydrolase [Cutibacterium acnes JCM 18920]|nr:haloacid dehalogenase-like hydrolase [Cutibacterium acnes JCM 18920]